MVRSVGWLVLSVLVLGCTGGGATSSPTTKGSPTGSPTGTPRTDTSDTGGSCSNFTVSTTTPAYTCSSGGLVSDLVPQLQLRDSNGDGCTGWVCAAGPLDVSVVLYNPCSVDVLLDTRCPVTGSALDDAVWAVSSSSTIDCYTDSGTYTLTTVPAGERVEVWSDTVTPNPGFHTLSYFMSDFPNPARDAFCEL